MIEFKVCPVRELYNITKDMQQQSWDETIGTFDPCSLNVDIDRRELAQSKNKYLCVAALDNNVVVGLCCFWVEWAALKSQPYAQNDLIFLKPEYRIGTNAKDLWSFCVDILVKNNIRDIRVNAPNVRSEAFFRLMGLKKRSTVYGKIYE